MNISVQEDKDVTCIPVNVLFKDGTKQLLEDGIVTECDHAAYTRSDSEFACRCGKISFDGGEWF